MPKKLAKILGFGSLFLLIVGAAIGGFMYWQAKQESKELKQAAGETLGGPLAGDGNMSIPIDTSDPQAGQFKQYEKYKDEKNILLGEVQKGEGAEAVTGKSVAIAYRGYLTTGQLFSQTQKQAYVFKIGDQGTIPGVQIGVVGMKVGGKRRVIVPPALGYGAKAHGQIPGSSVLVFDIELLDVR